MLIHICHLSRFLEGILIWRNPTLGETVVICHDSSNVRWFRESLFPEFLGAGPIPLKFGKQQFFMNPRRYAAISPQTNKRPWAHICHSGRIIFTFFRMHGFQPGFWFLCRTIIRLQPQFQTKKNRLKTCDWSMHLEISTTIYKIKIQVQNIFRTFFGIDRASKIFFFFYVQAMGPRARIPTKILCGKIVTDILTNLMQKVVSSENPTVPWVIILFEFIDDILTCYLHFVIFFKLRPFPVEAQTHPVTAWSRQRGRSNLIEHRH